LLATGAIASAGDFSITNVSVRNGQATLRWQRASDHYIVSQSPSLRTGVFDYVGSVLASNAVTLPVEGQGRFYRIREVAGVAPAAKSAILDLGWARAGTAPATQSARIRRARAQADCLLLRAPLVSMADRHEEPLL
jgi:hypothetical protein